MGFEVPNNFLHYSGNRKNLLGLLKLNDNLLTNGDLKGAFLTKASVKMLVNSFHYVWVQSECSHSVACTLQINTDQITSYCCHEHRFSPDC